MTKPYLIADLFCGAGGSSTGAMRAIKAMGREAITRLRQNKFPIMFATEKPAGYFLPANEKERLAGLQLCQSYIKECIIRAALKAGGARFLEGDKQLGLI